MKITVQRCFTLALFVYGFNSSLVLPSASGQDVEDSGSTGAKPMFVESSDVIRFEDRSRQKWGGPVIADFDRDGLLDLLINEHGHHTLIYWNEGGKFSEPLVVTRHDKHGLGVTDIGQDGQLDLIVSQGGGRGKNPRNPIRCKVNRDRTVEVGEEIEGFVRSRGRAVKFIDADNDGTPEILHTASPLKSQQEEGGNILYSQEESGAFTVSSYLPRTAWMGFRAIVTDYNGDHHNDVLFFGGKNITVAQGDAEANFTDASRETLGPAMDTTFVSSISEIDFDNDGDFDLFLTRSDHPFDPESSLDSDQGRFYFFTRQNKGFDLEEIAINGDFRVENFQTASPPVGVFVGAKKRELDLPGGKFGQKDFTLSPANAEGWPDDTSEPGIYIGHLHDDKWRVQAETKSANSGVLHGVKSQLESLPKERLPARLLENRDGVFFDVTLKLGIEILEQTTSSAVGDFNNDGWTDLFIVRYGNPAMPNEQILYLNHKGEKFVRAENHGLVSQELGATGGGAGVFDYDADGDLDLVFANERGRWHLFTNTTKASSDNHYVIVNVGRSPSGNASPRCAIVTLKAGNLKFTRVVNSNSWGLNHGLNTYLHIGLGAIDKIDEATVRWSNGETEKLVIESVNQTVSAGKRD